VTTWLKFFNTKWWKKICFWGLIFAKFLSQIQVGGKYYRKLFKFPNFLVFHNQLWLNHFMGDSHFCYMTKLKRENIDQDIVIKSASQKPTFNKFPTSLPTIGRNDILLTFNK
jgi:hypothetical protein